jgi:hypothetical protein
MYFGPLVNVKLSFFCVALTGQLEKIYPKKARLVERTQVKAIFSRKYQSPSV